MSFLGFVLVCVAYVMLVKAIIEANFKHNFKKSFALSGASFIMITIAIIVTS